MKDAFLKFANQLPKDAVLIACGDDKNVAEVLREYRGKKITYGFLKDNDFVVGNVKSQNGKLEFNLENRGRDLGKFKINIFGKHNALNATAAIIASLEVGLSIGAIRKALSLFVGTKRRSEYVGKLSSGAMLFDDYAHHPTEIRSTLSAFRDSFPNNKIVCVFQPHTYSRTKSLFEQFMHSFDNADTVILTNIYASLREQPDSTVSSKMLAEKMGKFKKNVIFLPKLSDVVKYISQKQFGKDTIVITMGAGDVYRINEKLKIGI